MAARLAAGRATVIIDLAHLADVPSLDPRTWTVDWPGSAFGIRDPEARRDAELRLGRGSPLKPNRARIPIPDPVCVAIDILDEDHSLRLAMRRLATDADAAGDAWRRRRAPTGSASIR